MAGSAPGTTKYYTVPLQKNATLYVSATLVGPPSTATQGSSTSSVKVSLRARDNYHCGEDTAFASITSERHTPTTAVLSRDLSRPGYERCPREGVGIIEVQRRGTAWQQQALPMEIVVRSEPPADSSGVAPGLHQAGAWPGATDVRERHPDRRWVKLQRRPRADERPDLHRHDQERGKTSSSESPCSGVNASATPSTRQTLPAPANTNAVYVATNFYNPMRQDILTTGTSGSQPWFAGRDTEPFTGSSNVPVRYTNRASSGSSVGHYQLDGSYYLRLNANFAPNQVSTRYRITAVVSGTPEAGPRYGAAVATDLTSTPTASPTPTSTPSTTATSGASSATSTDEAETVATSQSTGEGGGPGVLTIVLLLVAGLGGAGLAVAVMQARSRRTPADSAPGSSPQPPQGPQT